MEEEDSSFERSYIPLFRHGNGKRSMLPEPKVLGLGKSHMVQGPSKKPMVQGVKYDRADDDDINRENDEDSEIPENMRIKIRIEMKSFTIWSTGVPQNFLYNSSQNTYLWVPTISMVVTYPDSTTINYDNQKDHIVVACRPVSRRRIRPQARRTIYTSSSQ
ncbi:OLC1v1009062C1 [Oldenlandia corymbosa var. corymbosa]|uniref:OLC1v1009062C1 n=1 Tax=Oldenlandia corymbosa var. corymbosa TaxID=529605 RepID=A0AAV1DQH4_OLDCO|nr:OLC1v1009062C1 [Oldenlandia corymbosa var. corymbosa]